MPTIKPRALGQKHTVRLLAKVKEANLATLDAYAKFIGEDVDYVLDQLIETVLAKDKDFLAAQHLPPLKSHADLKVATR